MALSSQQLELYNLFIKTANPDYEDPEIFGFQNYTAEELFGYTRQKLAEIAQSMGISIDLGASKSDLISAIMDRVYRYSLPSPSEIDSSNPYLAFYRENYRYSDIANLGNETLKTIGERLGIGNLGDSSTKEERIDVIRRVLFPVETYQKSLEGLNLQYQFLNQELSNLRKKDPSTLTQDDQTRMDTLKGMMVKNLQTRIERLLPLLDFTAGDSQYKSENLKIRIMVNDYFSELEKLSGSASVDQSAGLNIGSLKGLTNSYALDTDNLATLQRIRSTLSQSGLSESQTLSALSQLGVSEEAISRSYQHYGNNITHIYEANLSEFQKSLSTIIQNSLNP